MLINNAGVMVLRCLAPKTLSLLCAVQRRSNAAFCLGYFAQLTKTCRPLSPICRPNDRTPSNIHCVRKK